MSNDNINEEFTKVLTYFVLAFISGWLLVAGCTVTKDAYDHYIRKGVYGIPIQKESHKYGIPVQQEVCK